MFFQLGIQCCYSCKLLFFIAFITTCSCNSMLQKVESVLTFGMKICHVH